MSIRCENIDIIFDNISFLEKVNLEIPECKRVLLYGPSGSGKTSIFNVLCGLSSAKNPEARTYWYDYSVSDLNEANKKRYQYISLIYSNFFYMQSLSVEENIVLPAVFAKMQSSAIAKMLDQLYTIFSFRDEGQKPLNLKDLRKRKMGQLSNGQKELVGIARALILDTPFIFADEMLRSYNSETEKVIWEKMMSPDLGIGSKRGFFLITHKEHLKNDRRIDIIYAIKNKGLISIPR